MIVHLVTILYRSKPQLADFLDSLAAQTAEWRLHVVDNASPDGSAALVAARGDPRIAVAANAANLGFAKAANQGMRMAAAAGAEFIVLINNDTVFAPDFLARLRDARDALGAEVLTPRIMLRDDPGTAWYAGGSFEDGWAGPQPRRVPS